MAYFDVRFVRPSQLDLIDALATAVLHANESAELIDLPRQRIADFIAGLRDHPEGFQQWSNDRRSAGDGAGLAAIAWWTDAAGRRHFRILAGSSCDGSFDRLGGPDRRQPPVWYFAPECIFWRTRGQGERKLLAACGCGATGTLTALRWMGDRCGACQDRGGEPCPGPGATFREADAVRLVAFSADGRWLAAAKAGPGVSVWDLRSRHRHAVLLPDGPAPIDMAFSHDGRQLLLASADRTLRIHDVETTREVQSLPMPSIPRAVAVAPNGLWLALVGRGSVEVWGRDAPGEFWRFVEDLGYSEAVATFSLDGHFLGVARAQWVYLFRLAELHELVLPRWTTYVGGTTPRCLGFNQDNAELIDIATCPTQLNFIDLEIGAIRSRRKRDALGGTCALSPDRGWFATVDSGRVIVERVHDSRPNFQLEADTAYRFLCLDFSPDGETLATGSVEGVVKLWPWRRLAEA
jgi:hypothetical protein